MAKSVIIYSTILLFLGSYAYGQQFSFEMYFEDAIGNMDTIVLGYDTLGTDSVDAIFNEVNVAIMAKDTGLDISIHNYYYDATELDTLAFKKQITGYDCDQVGVGPILGIHITTDHWPVTASWNAQLFGDTCVAGTILTGSYPGGWFDVAGPSDLFVVTMKYQSTVTFSSQVNSIYPYPDGSFAYIDTSMDTVSMFWFQFSKEYDIIDAVQPVNKTKPVIYPNPVKNTLVIENIGLIENLSIVSMLGKKLDLLIDKNVVDVSGLQTGIYLIDYTLPDGTHHIQRVIKE